MGKNLKKIELRTVPNGYTLTVEGTECMYFNEIDLMAGFLAHVGLGETSYMDKGTILSTLFSAMMGSAYEDSVTTLKLRVGQLSSQYAETMNRMDKAIEFVSQAEKTISGLSKRIDQLQDIIKGTEADHQENKNVVADTSRKLQEIEKRADSVEKSLANTATILQAMESVKNKKADKEDGEGPEKSDGKQDATDDSKGNNSAKQSKAKGKTTRKQRDEALMKKLQDNPNIK